MTVVKVGVSAWTEKTLVESGWYPPGARSAAGRLAYYAARFPLAEVDATYYALPARRQAEAWVERTPPGFTFDVKAYAPLTTHYTDPRRLPRDLAAALPVELRQKERVYPHELPQEVMGEITRRFREALEPLVASGKLGLVLFQYPVWFVYSHRNLEQLAGAASLVPGCRVAVELRNRTWLSERHAPATLATLAERGLAFTCVDEPQGFTSSVPPVAAATSDLAVVRMHGRNTETWEADVSSAAERMSYLYEPGELREWVPRLRSLAERASEIHVVMNNCYRDHAVRNAADMTRILAADPDLAPLTVSGREVPARPQPHG